MGFDIESTIVFGWEVDRDTMTANMKDRGAGSCNYDDDEICACGHWCWERKYEDGKEVVELDLFEHDFEIVKETPHPDADRDELRYFIDIPLPAATATAANAVPQGTIEYLRKLAVSWGAKDEEPHFYSVLQVG